MIFQDLLVNPIAPKPIQRLCHSTAQADAVIAKITNKKFFWKCDSSLLVQDIEFNLVSFFLTLIEFSREWSETTENVFIYLFYLYTLAVSPSLGGSQQHKRNKQAQKKQTNTKETNIYNVFI